MRNLASIIESGFPLIKIKAGDKEPAENWKESEYRDRPFDEFDGYNVAIKCGTELEEKGSGKFLGVIDIDPRNGGNLADIEKKYGQLPETFVVKTPSGGYHYYYYSDRPIQKCKLQTGVDFQGHGSYVLTIGSRLANGIYECVIDDPIAKIPDALGHFVDKKSGASVVDLSDWRDEGKIVSGGRNDYLTKMGGMMRRGGANVDEILHTLRVMNQSRCEPPLPEKEVSTIAKSVARYTPTEAVAATLPRVQKDPASPKITPEQTTRAAAKIESQLSEALKMTEGLIKNISNEILSHCDRRYDSFALASAMTIVGAAAQGGFSAPHLMTPGASSGGLSMYNWLIAPSAAGKEAYRQAVMAYVAAIDERLVCPKIGSNYGLRSALFAFNSQVSIVDEMQDEFDRLGGQKSSTYLNQVLTEMKELTNDLKELRPVVVKSIRYPAVQSPRYSIYGVGTVEGFIRHLTASLIGGGLLSRFAIWPITEVPSKLFQQRMTEAPEAHVKALKKIFADGLTYEGQTQDHDFELQRFHGLDSVSKKDEPKEKVTHKPQNDASKTVMDCEPEARLMLQEFSHFQEKIYLKLVHENMASTDTSPGSVADRAPRFALKLASVHAVGCGRVVINANDASIGIKIAKALADYLCDIVAANAGDTFFDKNCNRLLAKIKKHAPEPITKRKLQQNDNLKPKELDACLLTLCQSGRVHAIDSDGVLRSLDDVTTLPPKLSFVLDTSVGT